MENDRKKVLLIVNPCAGKNKSRTGTFDIVDKFSNNDYEFTVRTTTCQGDATNIVKRELEGKDLVVCCGGDGTLNETINGVMDMPKRVPIGYIPTGTTCDLASTLGIPSDVKKATDIIISGNTNDYDIGLFNNRYFSYVASFGAFTKCSYATPQKLKNRFGHAAYVFTALGEVKDVHGIFMRIEHDGGVIEGKFSFGAVSNSTSVAGMFKLIEDDVRLNDGIFEVLLVPEMGLFDIIPTIRKAQKQDYDGKRVIYLRTSKIKITSPYEEVDWTLDGEYGGSHSEVMIHVLERAVRICTNESPLFVKHSEPAAEQTEEAKSEPEAPKKAKGRKKSK
ncbi:MAG: YegS/Rv2252/BmrU family lipid kinase [Clostridia bacterium]|nr:YegS/Rv2252/BmrU family lipid kinase [Clostridia bacterium]